MKPVVIGFDTSCYTTSCAAVTVDGDIICSSRKLLPVPQGARGLRQSEMVFIHTRQLHDRVQQVKAAIGSAPIAAVCASTRPRDEEDSYMPAFQVGEVQGRNIAALLGVPFFSSTHQRGHIRAASVDSGLNDENYLAVHLSGGTTEIVCMQADQLKLLGGSLDLHAGQLVDRAGVAMGLSFPAGPSLEKLALQGHAHALLPSSIDTNDGLGCHFSGAEAQIVRWLQKGAMDQKDIAAEIYDLLARTISKMILIAADQTGVQCALIAGGVASSALFRQLLINRIQKMNRSFSIYFGRPEFSGDNAVGTALIGAAQWQKTMLKKG